MKTNFTKENDHTTALLLAADIKYIKQDISEIKQSFNNHILKEELAFNKLSERDEKYVLREDFTFWRNILISGILLTVFIGIIMNGLK